MDTLPKELISEIAKYTSDADMPLRRVSKLCNEAVSDINAVPTSINMHNVPFIFVKEYYKMLASLGVRIFSNSRDIKDLKTLRSTVESVAQKNKDVLYHDSYKSVVFGCKDRCISYSYLGKNPLKTFSRHRKTLNDLIKLYWQITVFPDTQHDIYYLIELYKEKDRILHEMESFLTHNRIKFFFKYVGGKFDSEYAHTRFIIIELSKIKNRHHAKHKEFLNPVKHFDSIYDEYFANRLIILNGCYNINVIGFTSQNDANMLLALAYIDYHSYNHESINTELIYTLYDCYTCAIQENGAPLFELQITTEYVNETMTEIVPRILVALDYVYNTKTKVLPTLTGLKFL